MKIFMTLVFGLTIAGCTGSITYAQRCKDSLTSVTESPGIGFSRSVGRIEIVSDQCGRAVVTAAETDAVQAFKAGVDAGKQIAGSAIAGPAGAVAP